MDGVSSVWGPLTLLYSVMRIVFITPGFPKNNFDDTSLPARQTFVRALAEKTDWDVQVLALQYPFVRSSYSIGKMEIHALGGANRSKIGQIGIWKRARSKLEELHQEAPIDVIHSFWLGKTTLLGQSMTARHGIKHIASIGGQEVRNPNLLLRFVKWDRLKLTSGSEFAARTFKDKGGPSCDVVIPFGLDPDRIGQSKGAAKRDIDIIGVGSLIRLKQYDQFLEVLSKVAKAYPGLRALLVGDGPEREKLQEYATKLGLADCVEFKGHVSRTEVLALMNRSKILLHPSEYESQGYVFLEALYAGLDLISRSVGYRPISERVWTCDSTGEMSATILSVLKDKEDFEAELAFTVEQSIEAFSKLYGVKS